MRVTLQAFFVLFCSLAALLSSARGETGYPSLPYNETEEAPPASKTQLAPPLQTPPSSTGRRRDTKRKFFNDDSKRIDAGVFHVGFAAGGNFYTQHQSDLTTGIPTGDYYKDFGFQAGVFFDHDYSELEDNIPLMLRGMVGYKYILNSVHVFAFDGLVRRMFRFSDAAAFGVGVGVSAAIWYQTSNSASAVVTEDIVFLPSLLIGAGFEFEPFMIDFKWLINKFGAGTAVTGFELYFGFRL